MSILRKIISFPFIFLVKIYQWIISPIFPANCRYNPTCSHYMIEAINEWGIFKGIYLGTKRISKCHPWGGFGDDPVPKKKK
ncbi:MAG: membrane protein insertion efficiency factor YidD [Bacteroidota bacterium]